MTSNELLIGFGGLLLLVLTYFAGVIRTKQRDKTQAKEKRIDDFVNIFFSQYKGTGKVIELLIPSGINNLQNDDEIKIAIEKLRNRLRFHPLRAWNSEIKTIGYKVFFDYILKKGKPLDKSNIDGAISEIKHTKQNMMA